MKFSLATVLLGLAALASAARIDARQNQGRPVPSGACCAPNASLKQDSCTATNGQAGKCVPGGNNCKPCPLFLLIGTGRTEKLPC